MKTKLVAIRMTDEDSQIVLDLQKSTGIQSKSEIIRLALRKLKVVLGK
jgi:hypothetical protein